MKNMALELRLLYSLNLALLSVFQNNLVVLNSIPFSPGDAQPLPRDRLLGYCFGGILCVATYITLKGSQVIQG